MGSKKTNNLNEAITKALHKSASVAKIKQEEPRLLKRLRMCKTENEVRLFQADLKKKQEILFQLLLKSETMVATGMYCPKAKPQGFKGTETQTGAVPAVPPKTAVKRPHVDVSKASGRPKLDPPPPPNQETASNLQPIDGDSENAQPNNAGREDARPTTGNRRRGRSQNVLSWNLEVREIRETAI